MKRQIGKSTEYLWGPIYIIDGPAALSIWIWKVLITWDGWRTSVRWNPD